MTEKDSGIDRIIISYKLTSQDIFRLILRIHWILLILPIAFLVSYVFLAVSDYFGSGEALITFIIFALALLGILYLYLSQYFIFKKFYYFSSQNEIYYAEIHKVGLTVYQEKGKNLTEYIWQDFCRCRETKKAYYFYFRYDRAFIVKKQLFIKGTVAELNVLIKENVAKFKKYRKSL